MSRTVVLRDERCIDHVIQPGHPESPERLQSIYGMLRDRDMAACIHDVKPRRATRDEIALNHAPAYVERIASTAGMAPMSLDLDTGTSAGSWDAATLAVGAVLDGIDMIMQGRADNGFALVRPPGHHAENARAMGFCLFNNAAIGAHYLISKYRLQRVLVIDWDIHHGNGTQHAFYNTPQVLYFSTHQYPYYPGTGAFEEVGEGDGRGFTVNVPLPGGQGDKDYARIFKEILIPMAQQYRPEFVIVSAGYDIYQRDPLGTMDVTPQGFGRLAGIVKKMADTVCSGRLLCTLEGGYHVKGLTESVKQTLLALCSDSGTEEEAADCAPAARSSLDSIIAHVKKVHAFAWPVFRP